MATWTTPRTWTTGEFPSAATMNTHVRDNFGAVWHEMAGGAGAAATMTTTPAPLLIPSAATYSGNLVRIMWSIQGTVPLAGNQPLVYLYDTGSLLVASLNTDHGAGQDYQLNGIYRFNPSAGAHTYQLWGAMAFGSYQWFESSMSIDQQG